MTTGCFTICSRNYLAYTLTLRDSLREHEPDLPFTIFLADAPLQDGAPEDVEITTVSEIGIENLDNMAWRYNVVEFNTAVKPFCFDYLFDTKGLTAAIYLDPDIRLFGPLTAVHAALADGASCVLTPHICAPLTDDKTPSDIDLMRSGTFNLGFGAFAKVPEARAFLSWWGDKLRQHCRVDLENGLFVDQRFVDFAPSFLERLSILRDPSYNVAYWNLAHRSVAKSGAGWTAGGRPLAFFHFSGVVPGAADIFSKHQSRFDMTNIGEAAGLVRDYTARIEANGHAHWSAIPYTYGRFATGEPIADPMRRGPPADPADPFAAPNHAYWNTPSDRVDQTAGAAITRLMLAIHDARTDLRQAFPLSTKAGRRDFHAWFIAHGAREYRLGEASIAPALSASILPGKTLARLRLALRRPSANGRGNASLQ
ncbi:MAG: group 1 glycosyl transferase [Rhodobiaceae bacterium]|nr:hypothetical protein [Hyphomonas sp.]MCB9970028.1 group 1 glycosyl transferase [Hyphomonas sp.]MCC0050329.1 group 1 glycosyl transferase [Rhodobiaceae bacterium]